MSAKGVYLKVDRLPRRWDWGSGNEVKERMPSIKTFSVCDIVDISQCIVRKVRKLKNITIADMTEILREYFRDMDEILLAFIFGSSVSGRLTRHSDVDVAVLFDKIPDFSDVVTLRDTISAATDRDVDIVVLNGSSPIISMQVLKRGIVIKSRASSVYNNFFVKTVKEYDDLKRIRKEAEENILKGRIYA
jgi:predicted nucleotidyltransferase